VRSATRLAAAASLAPLLAAAGASAAEVPNVGGKPMLIDVTNTSIIDYHFNNRNDAPPGISSVPNQDDDFYGEWLDRLNVQLSWWRLRFGLRLDTALYYHTPNADTVATLIADQKQLINQIAGLGAPVYAINYADAFYRDLHTRYLRTVYPAKLYLGYTQPGVDVTVGDFYVQLGRGLVFSARKIDELAVDTTVRGAKVVADHAFGPVQLGATLFAGQMNPLRIDDPSGRRLNGEGSALFFGFPQDGPLRYYNVVAPQPGVPGMVSPATDPATPNYFEDTVVGGRIELGTKYVQFAENTAVLLRKAHDYATTDPSREHNRILNASGSINVPSILQHGDLYLEVAGQQMGDGQSGQPDLSGYAVYASGTVTGGPVSVSLELKNYRNFFPLSANVDTTTAGHGAPEFSLLTYSQPPTAEPIYNEVISGGSPDVCITGGRARVDYRFGPHLSAFAWLGRYTSWSEIPATLSPNDGSCVISAQTQTNSWDTAAGFDLGYDGGKSHAKAWVGEHVSDDVVARAAPGLAVPVLPFYHEGYLRYDVIMHLAGPVSLQMQGFHRHRYEPLSYPQPWMEGENYIALQWSPHLSAAFGMEYLTNPDLCPPARPGTPSQSARTGEGVCTYVNGGITWRSHGSGTAGPTQRAFEQLFDTVRAFVGQTRPAVRCVSGVCRSFPAFEGARLEITSRF
jgi:hypothetical protein